MVGFWNVQGKYPQVQLLSLHLNTELLLLLVRAAAWEPEQHAPARMTDILYPSFVISPCWTSSVFNSSLLAASNGAAEHLGKNAGCVSKNPALAEEQFVFS